MGAPSKDVAYQPTVRELKYLIGNPDAYAVQNDDGSWYPVRERVTPRVLRSHLDGEQTIGTYIVRPPGEAKTLVFDVDAEEDEEQRRQLRAVCAVLIDARIPYVVEWSGRKGYHVWVIARDYVWAEALYRIGRGVRNEAGLGTLEVFPKQTAVRDLGNLVKLPGGVHRVTGQENLLFAHMPDFLSAEDVDRLAALYPEVTGTNTGPVGVENPCVATIQAGTSEGGRNEALYHLAAMTRRASLNEDTVRMVLRAANEKNDPPLDDAEVEAIIASSVNGGPICKRLPDDVNCGDECIMRKHQGLFTKKGRLQHAAEGEEVVVRVKRRVEGGVELEHEDIEEGFAQLKASRRKKS